MHILGLDTSTMTGSVAVVTEQRVLVEYTLHTRVTHTERLLGAIDSALKAVELSVHDLDGIAVSIGPGSFTGLRIGVTTAKSLAYSLQRPIAGITSLDALAARYLFTPTLVCPLLDARKREVYAAFYRNPGPDVQRVSNHMVASPESLFRTVTDPVILLGDGVLPYRSKLENLLGVSARFADVPHSTPSGSMIAQLGYARLKAGDADDALTLAPLYVRKSDAEIHWEQRQAPTV
jgi:tRNA threonylcarbamoyladenosine biosynthesis protein TsaB